MRHVVILGGGTAGTMIANRLRATYAPADMSITVIDHDDQHVYQPGFLFLPFGKATRKQILKKRSAQLTSGVTFLETEILRVDADANTVFLRGEPQEVTYDDLIIATGTQPHPELTEGLDTEGVFHFYDLPAAEALREGLRYFRGGDMVVHIAEMPIKCPVAPLEFTFLADSWLRKKGLREKTRLTFVTPLDGAFTKPVASKQLGGALEDRQIEIATDFDVDKVDPASKELVGFDGRRIHFDMLVTVPVNMGAEFIANSGLGDEHNYVPCDPHTMQSVAHQNIFVLGDAGTLPTSKAGAVAHFAADVFMENFDSYLRGEPMTASFDGHANCFVETGDGLGMLLDFNYDTQPLTGTFPFPKVGPLSLLKESRVNHWAKLAFRWVYWNILIKGRPLPMPSAMFMAGKNREGQEKAVGYANHGDKLTIVPESPKPSRLAEFTGAARGAEAAPQAGEPGVEAAQSAAETGSGGASLGDAAGVDLVAGQAGGTRTVSTSRVDVPEEKAPNSEWTKELAATRAEDLGIHMTDQAWTVIEFLRADYPVRKETPTLRRVSTQTGVSVRDLYGTFTVKPAKKMAWIAGLPKPRGCV